MENSERQLPQAVAENLLDKLSTDDAFRLLFVQNVVAALQQAGATEAQANACGSCLKVHELADKTTIKNSLVALTSMLTASMGHSPHKLSV